MTSKLPPRARPAPRESVPAPEKVSRNETFVLKDDHIELNRLLKLSGCADSGGGGKMLVASGAVKVDDKVELRKTCKIRAGQVVTLGDVRIRILADDA